MSNSCDNKSRNRRTNFSYTSLNAQQSGTSSSGSPLVLAREDITFTNKSTGTYTFLEWDFGDGTPVERFYPFSGTTSPVIHQYGIDGTYYATLRLYNSVGCFEELVKVITVGKGYNILVPNVFTPTTGKPKNLKIVQYVTIILCLYLVDLNSFS